MGPIQFPLFPLQFSLKY